MSLQLNVKQSNTVSEELTITTMAKVNPFKGVRYDRSSVSNLMDLLAPPYDVISPDYQESLYKRNDKNVIRLILDKIKETDSDKDNRYTRAKSCLDEWMSDGTLKQDEKPALYLYAQDYKIGDETLRRVGFICRRLAEPLGETIFPHERTLSGPKTDRLNLTRACKMNFSQVFGLYSDSGKVLDTVWEKIMAEPADVVLTDDDGQIHSMWIVTDEAIIEKTQEFMEDKPIVIADGHHRYETALNYRNERRAEENREGEADYDYVMMYLSNTHGQGFTVLPTHRLVKNVSDINADEVLLKLGASFDITSRQYGQGVMKAFLEDLIKSGADKTSFGLYAGDGKLYLLTLKEGSGLPEGDGSPASEALRKLDVNILQGLIFEKMLGVSKEAVADKSVISYTVDAEEAVREVDSGSAKLAFLLNRTGVDQIIDVATKGGVMPQKSTYFYPKLITGLVFNPLS